MNSKVKVRSIVFSLEGFDLNQPSKASASLPTLDKIIAEGNSTLIVDENQISKTNPLVSVLSFARTFNDGFDESIKVKAGELRIFEAQKVAKTKQGGGDDEEIIEVKYISHPKKLSKLTDASVFVVTDSEKVARFCESAEINYFYQSGGYEIVEVYNKIGAERNIDILVIHREAKEESRADVLNWVENTLKSGSLEFDFLRIILSPFGENIPVEKLIQSHEHQDSKSEETQNALKSIVPVQTWQYYRGKAVLQEGSQIKYVWVMITNRKELNRADRIQSINDYASQENIGKFGGKVIHTFGVLREILFELGKLPKFGA